MLKPIRTKILVKPLGKSNVTESGIIIPDADTKEKFLEKGYVVESGHEVSREINNSSVIYYDRWAGTEVNVEGEPFLMMKEEDVQAYER